MSFDSVELAWNSVNVRFSDGLLHNGRVVDTVAGGLVVHFGGTGYSGRKQISFGHIYHRYPDYFRRHGYNTNLGQTHEMFAQQGPKNMPPLGPVDVLLRLQPEGRWKWYPGTLLEAFGLVSVILPDRELKGLVMQDRIQESPSEAYLANVRVEEGVFWKDVVAVPDELTASHASDDQLVTVFNTHCRERHYWMMATQILKEQTARHVLSRKLVVLGVSDELGWLKEHVTGRYVSNKFRNTCQEPLDQLLLSLFNADATSMGTIQFPSVPTPCPEGDIRSLHRDRSILPQIFECLTTIQQTKLRGVCRQWDAVLTSSFIRRIISFSPPRIGPDYTRDLYGYASGVYNCWTREAKVMVFVGGSHADPGEGRLDSTARLLQRIMIEKELPPAELLLLAGEWNGHCSDPNWISAFCGVFVTLGGVCQQVVVKNVEVKVEVGGSDRHDGVSIGVRFSHLRITRRVTADEFWAMVNKGLSYLDHIDVGRLVEWVDQPTNAREIAQILNLTQTLEPGDGVRYRGMTFAPYGDANLHGVDARQLTKLTQHALLQLANNPEQHTFVFHVR